MNKLTSGQPPLSIWNRKPDGSGPDHVYHNADSIFRQPATCLQMLNLMNAQAEWNLAVVTERSYESPLTNSFSLRDAPFETITNVWHPKLINLAELDDAVLIAEHVFETTYSPIPLTDQYSHEEGPRIIVKVTDTINASKMRDGYSLSSLQQETEIYKSFTELEVPLASRFLGHVHGNGKVIGLALEKIPNARRPTFLEDFMYCESALRRFHSCGYRSGRRELEDYLVTGTGVTTAVYLIGHATTTKAEGMINSDQAVLPDMEYLNNMETQMRQQQDVLDAWDWSTDF
ncbi:hypothetical protein KEM56_004367 [Ascosphaera pollenicola]|nr:hypothetical protein KEM56_004367 [Ascosphaera pollenicola]